MSKFTERLKNLREITGKTQNDVGLGIGKSRGMVAKYEGGTNEPDLNTLANIAKFFGVSADYILGSTDCDNIIIINCSNQQHYKNLKDYELLLNDENFVQYIKLAAKIKENNIDILDIETFINNIIKYKTRSK